MFGQTGQFDRLSSTILTDDVISQLFSFCVSKDFIYFGKRQICLFQTQNEDK